MPFKDKSKYLTDEYREYRRKYQRVWHQKHKVKRLAQVSERKNKVREFYKQLKENLVCAQCGENHPAALQFHHRDPKTKDFNLAETKQRAFGIERIMKEIAKCTVLCANCHAKLHCESTQGNVSFSQGNLAAEVENLQQKLELLQEEFQDQSDFQKEVALDSLGKATPGNAQGVNRKQSELFITKALTSAGYNVLKPQGQLQHYNLVIEDANGHFWRVQCKIAQLSKNRSILKFAGNYIIYRQTEQNKEIIGDNYQGKVDYFAVYSPELEKTYLIPITSVVNTTNALRLVPTKNSQVKNVRYAAAYEL